MKHTQKQLEEMSDFEINMLIAHYDPAVIADDQMMWNKEVTSVLMHDIASMWEVDYCNNWVDMGPLINKEQISIVYDNACEVTGAYYDLDIDLNTFDFYCTHKNPLRAAAIVYILIKQRCN